MPRLKIQLCFIALLCATPLFGTGPAATISGLRDPLPFPEPISVPAPSLEAALAESAALNQWIGGYPARIRDVQQRREIYATWQHLLAGARALQAQQGDTEQISLLLARLYRQGHNLDVLRCGEHALKVLEPALATYPQSDSLLLESSYFYLSINPKFAPKGEAALMKLRQLRGTDRDIEIERGLIFAYLYQNRIKEAKAQIEHCLELSPGDKMLLQLREGLKNQTSIETKPEKASTTKP